MSEFILEPESPPGTAAVGRRLASMSIMDFAIDLTPSITESNTHMHEGAVPIEYILSETAETEADWRSHELYDQLQAQKLGWLIVRQSTKPDDIAEKLELIDESLAHAQDRTSVGLRNGVLQQYIVRSARYDALKRVGLLSATADSLPAATRAAYEFAAIRSDTPLDQATTVRCREIERARRIYSARLFGTMVQPTPYQTLETSDGASAKLWWQQLATDLRTFQSQTI